MRILVTNRVWKQVMYAIIALIVVNNVSWAIIGLNFCNPLAKQWNPTLKGSCWSQESILAIHYCQGGKTAKNTLFL